MQLDSSRGVNTAYELKALRVVVNPQMTGPRYRLHRPVSAGASNSLRCGFSRPRASGHLQGGLRRS
jgi:hypothetical protein